MTPLARLPKALLLMEALGGLMALCALLLANRWLPLPAHLDSKTLATALLMVGILLMLPAAWLMMWRTARAMAPQLFGRTTNNNKTRRRP
ncbi:MULTISPECIES: DUF1418 family protein [Pantoea]|uniref:DUF1418 domain-containing protein n=1 Tax=Pantoea latae TaxID=1964541 RepID=A0A1V9DPV1_9GAMM|nr:MULTISPECIES: DUF1418 family protein [Pantoea]OQP35860.1 hypothetical protein B2J69_02365 [Pantoea latae]